jgi:hypothetical protein
VLLDDTISSIKIASFSIFADFGSIGFGECANREYEPEAKAAEYQPRYSPISWLMFSYSSFGFESFVLADFQDHFWFSHWKLGYR